MFYLYALGTGIFTGAAFDVSPATDERISACTPEGFGAWQADAIDHLSQRVDVSSTPPVLVDYVPPKPADTALVTFAWDAQAKRWQPTATPAGRKPEILADIKAKMAAAEAEAQDRPSRELLLAVLAGQTPNAATVTRLQSVDAALASLRALYESTTSATTQQELDAVVSSLASEPQ